MGNGCSMSEECQWKYGWVTKTSKLLGMQVGERQMLQVKAILKEATAFIYSSVLLRNVALLPIWAISLMFDLTSFIHVFKNDSVYSVLGMQATAANKKQSLFSKTLQSSGKVKHENSYFQICMISVPTGTNTGYHRSIKERRWDCEKLWREESKASLLLLLLLSRVNHVQLLATPWTVAYQAPLSTGFSWQEYWSGLPLPSPVKCLLLLLLSRFSRVWLCATP